MIEGHISAINKDLQMLRSDCNSFSDKARQIFSFAASRNSARDNVFPVALSKIGTHTIFNLSGMPVFILPLGFEDLVKFLLKICAW